MSMRNFSCLSDGWQGVHKKQRSRQRGRPVKYQGDPNAPGLDPAQRRQLQRRISNRESARRTRKRHEYQLTGMHAKVCALIRTPTLRSVSVVLPLWVLS